MGFSLPCGVSFYTVCNDRLKKISIYAISARLCPKNISCPVFYRGICIIHSERNTFFQAVFQKNLFLIPCVQGVQVDMYIIFGKSLAVKRRFSAGLQADKDNCFFFCSFIHLTILLVSYMDFLFLGLWGHEVRSNRYYHYIETMGS